MAYVKNTWVDQDVERPRTYEVTNNQDGSITLTDSFGVVTELGTPVDADNMNHIEDGIAQCYTDLAHNDLTNLTDEGEKHFLGQKQISNCVTEIPQRIKYTFEDGTLTILAGSVVIVPYGTTDLTDSINIGDTFLNANYKVYDRQYTDGKFFVWAEIQEDIVYTSAAGDAFGIRSFGLSLDNNGTYFRVNQMSGTTSIPPKSGVYYRTDLNVVQVFNDINDSTPDLTNCSFPFIRGVTNLNNFMDGIAEVFNGIGYIGGIIWADKGIKMLIPDGRNADGTLKNIEVETDKITFETNTSGNYTRVLFWEYDNNKIGAGTKYWEGDTPPLLIKTEDFWRYYNIAENVYYTKELNSTVYNKAYMCKMGLMQPQDDIINSFQNFNTINVATKADIDSEWLAAGYVLADNLNLNNANNEDFEISLKNILPNDGAPYLCLIEVAGDTSATSGQYTTVFLKSSIQEIRAVSGRPRTNATVSLSACVPIVIMPDRKLAISRRSNYYGTIYVGLRGYKRTRANG